MCKEIKTFKGHKTKQTRASMGNDNRAGRHNIRTQLVRANYNVFALAHGEVAEKRDDVCGNVEGQNTAQANVIVDESDDCSGNQKAALYTSEKESIRLDELPLWGELLDQRRDGWPEHPEAGGNQSIHQIKLPDLDLVSKSKDRDSDDYHGTNCIQPHHQPPPVFTIDHDASEGKHQHRRHGLEDGERTEGHFGMSGLQDVPGNCGRVHPAADHRNEVGGKDESQGTLAETGTHLSNLADGNGIHHEPI